MFGWHPPFFPFDLAIDFLARFWISISLSLAVVLPDSTLGFIGSHYHFAGSTYLWVFVGFLVLFGLIGSIYFCFVKFFACSGFVHHIVCLPVVSCIIVSTMVAAPSGSLQPELCLP